MAPQQPLPDFDVQNPLPSVSSRDQSPDGRPTLLAFTM